MLVNNSKKVTLPRLSDRFYLFCYKGTYFVTDNAYYNFLAIDRSGEAHIFRHIPEFDQQFGVWRDVNPSTNPAKEVFHVADENVFDLVKLTFEERRGINIPDYLDYIFSVCPLHDIYVSTLSVGDLSTIINTGVVVRGTI